MMTTNKINFCTVVQFVCLIVGAYVASWHKGYANNLTSCIYGYSDEPGQVQSAFCIVPDHDA